MAELVAHVECMACRHQARIRSRHWAIATAPLYGVCFGARSAARSGGPNCASSGRRRGTRWPPGMAPCRENARPKARLQAKPPQNTSPPTPMAAQPRLTGRCSSSRQPMRPPPVTRGQGDAAGGWPQSSKKEGVAPTAGRPGRPQASHHRLPFAHRQPPPSLAAGCGLTGPVGKRARVKGLGSSASLQRWSSSEGLSCRGLPTHRLTGPLRGMPKTRGRDLPCPSPGCGVSGSLASAGRRNGKGRPRRTGY